MVQQEQDGSGEWGASDTDDPRVDLRLLTRLTPIVVGSTVEPANLNLVKSNSLLTPLNFIPFFCHLLSTSKLELSEV